MKKIFLYIICLLFILIISPLYIFSQVHTVQDCLGAIPICQNIYSTTTSYSGTGNYPNEINTTACPASCLMSGNKNDVHIGVYIYKIVLREKIGVKHLYNGSVTIIP